MPLDKPRPVTTIKIRNINVHWYMGRTIERGIQGVPLTPGPGFFWGPKCLRMLPVKQSMRPFLSGIRVMKLVLVIMFVVSLTEALFFGNSSNIGGKLTVVGLKINSFYLTKLGQMNTDHPYWHQVQGEMAATNLEWANFALWTQKDFRILRIQKCNNWKIDHLPKLKHFYLNVLLPQFYGS